MASRQTDDAKESLFNRIAIVISKGLSECLAPQLCALQDWHGENVAQIIIQARLCRAGKVDEHPIIHLGSIETSQLVGLVNEEHQAASRAIKEQSSSSHSQVAHQKEHICNPHVPPSPPTSFNGEEMEILESPPPKRRKCVGGLRPIHSSKNATNGFPGSKTQPEDGDTIAVRDDVPRRLQSDIRKLPQRKKPISERNQKEPRSATKLIASIWKTIYGSIRVEPPATFDDHHTEGNPIDRIDGVTRETFSRINAVCLKASTLSKSARALEVIVQAYWVDCYNARIKMITAENPRLSPTEARMAVLGEACSTLGWTQKELRNRMSIWRSYKEIKDAGGWVALVFAGPGIYGICKYRIGFEDGLMQRLSKLRTSIEVAADTLHPAWRRLLRTVDPNTELKYTGHPHDWVVSAEKAAVPLASTYQQWDPEFSFRHLEECIIDDCWSGRDPRRVFTGEVYACSECGEQQSEDIQINRCVCFPSLIATSGHPPAPVQVGRSPRGKNNGLFARCRFDRGTAIGEFVGLVTKGIEGMDVMMGGQGDNQYQIYQRCVGNYTRFINHSCAPNAQFAKFVWLGVERIMVVSRGIESGMEITVDYSPSYWDNLDKACLCGETCCRYNRLDRCGGGSGQ